MTGIERLEIVGNTQSRGLCLPESGADDQSVLDVGKVDAAAGRIVVPAEIRKTLSL
jgi:hypothetical protein